MNEAISQGARKGLGYGESLAEYVGEHPDRFPYKEDCVFYQAYLCGIPATYHIALGTDIIHQHWRHRNGQRAGFPVFLPQREPAGSGSLFEFRLRSDRTRGVLEGAVHFPEFGLSHLSHHHRQF